jgi:hypothetical protein
MGYLSSFSRGNLIFFESLGLHTLSDTPCRELSKSGEEQFFFAHMISEIVSFCESLDIFVCFDGDSSPFFVNDIRENRKFITFIDTMVRPIVGQLVSSFLTRHPLLNPLLTPAMFLPELSRAIERNLRITHFLHSLIAHTSEPCLEWFSFWGWN